jgi:EAL and modified HD-GYP domain-containing signal transduction protein
MVLPLAHGFEELSISADMDNVHSSAARTSPLRQHFVARQPVFDCARNVYGYELLFRNGLEQCFSGDRDVASRSTLDSSLLLGLDTLCDGRLGFVNCTCEVLLKDLITLLPANQTVVEILETVEPDDRVIAACKRLKAAGYRIALDDFVANDPRERLCEFADIIKVDLRATTIEQRAGMILRLGSPKLHLLAEKVETPLEFEQSRKMGFSYFQGYFFCRPELVKGRELPASRLHQLRLLEMASRNELDLRQMESMIKQEPSISYRLLRYLNSPVFGFSLEIKSIRHAMAVLGERELRRWIRLVVTVGAAEHGCTELVLMGLTRARFCELFSPHFQSDGDLFLMGLLSVMDAILEVSIDRILEKIPLERETKAALLGQESRLRPLYRLMLAMESGEWKQAAQISAQTGIPDEKSAALWWSALDWAQKVCKGL